MTEIADPTTRRAVLGGAAAMGASAVLAACGGGSDPESSPPRDDSNSSVGGEGTAGDALGTTSEVPVGGGTVFKDAKVVVTQPTEGEFKAFTAVCTHTGCIVASVQDDTIQCNCHGSRYSATDGSVTGGPAPSPLAAKKVSVEDDALVLG